MPVMKKWSALITHSNESGKMFFFNLRLTSFPSCTAAAAPTYGYTFTLTFEIGFVILYLVIYTSFVLMCALRDLYL